MNLNTSNILLCLRYGIGDLIMELPLIDRLRETLPWAKLTGLGAEPAIEVLDDDGRLDEVTSIQQWGIQHLGDPTDESVQQRFTDWLLTNRFDLVLDPSHAANVVRRIIYQHAACIRDCDPACLEAGLAQGRDGLSAVKWGVLHGWDLEVPESSYPAVRLQPEELAWARQFLGAADTPARHSGPAPAVAPGHTIRPVAVSPGASQALKRWPVENFARLCRYLVEELRTRVLLFGGSGEAKLLRDLAQQTRDLPHLEIVCNLPLRRVAALLAQCTLYVGNDSGLMHLAAAVGTPVVILFGPTVPDLYLPQWVRSRAVVSDTPCVYRPRRAFGHPRCTLAETCLIGTPCMQTIDPDQVCAAVREEYRG
jgi:ADP-heptose:LPS heptosyltransferase